MNLVLNPPKNLPERGDDHEDVPSDTKDSHGEIAEDEEQLDTLVEDEVLAGVAGLVHAVHDVEDKVSIGYCTFTQLLF